MGKPRPNRLRVWRADRRLTQLLLARKSHVSTTRISLIENELLEATEREREALARALRVPVTDIFPPAQESVAS